MADEGHEEAVVAVAPPPPAELTDIKLFGRWSCDDVQISDMSLQVLIQLALLRVFPLFVHQFPRSCQVDQGLCQLIFLENALDWLWVIGCDFMSPLIWFL